MKFKDLNADLIAAIEIECKKQKSNLNLEAYIHSLKISGGFDWDKTEDPVFWNDVLGRSDDLINYGTFYKKYPQNHSNIKIESLDNKTYYTNYNGKKVKITIEYLDEE